MKRLPAVAGQFYEGDPLRLKKQVEQYIIKDTERERVTAILSPHAGLMYSGHVAGALYSSIRIPKTFILLGPNHTGLGPDISIMSSGQWEIPTATFEIDEDLGQKVKSRVQHIVEDTQAHLYEHSLEVQLPFIAYSSDKCCILPICAKKASVEECKSVGRAIAAAVRESGYDIVIVASSDMSHFEQDSDARRLDNLALKELLDLNPEGLYSIVLRERITMCGFIPAVIMLYAALELGATEARLIKYATSAEVSGDYDRVVGYAGVVIK